MAAEIRRKHRVIASLDNLPRLYYYKLLDKERETTDMYQGTRSRNKLGADFCCSWFLPRVPELTQNDHDKALTLILVLVK